MDPIQTVGFYTYGVDTPEEDEMDILPTTSYATYDDALHAFWASQCEWDIDDEMPWVHPETGQIYTSYAYYVNYMI